MTAWAMWFDLQEQEMLAAGARALRLDDLPLSPTVDPLAVRHGYPSSQVAEEAGHAGARRRLLQKETA